MGKVNTMKLKDVSLRIWYDVDDRVRELNFDMVEGEILEDIYAMDVENRSIVNMRVNIFRELVDNWHRGIRK